MAYGTVTGSINIQQSADHAAVDSYIVVMDWNPIADDPTTFTYTQLVGKAAVPGDSVVSRPAAPTVQGNMYVRAYAAQGSIVGVLSNEVMIPFDFRPGAPVISLV